MGTPAVARQKPLGADVLHYGIPAALGGLLHLLDKDCGPRVLLLHGNQVGRTQFATRQVRLNLAVGGKTVERKLSLTSHPWAQSSGRRGGASCLTALQPLFFFFFF